MDLRAAIRRALNELGVPGEGYPAPVANAVNILQAALAATSSAAPEVTLANAAGRRGHQHQQPRHRQKRLSPEPDHD